MTLEELLYYVNDSTFIKVFSAASGNEIATYDGKDSLPEDINGYEVTDIFVDGTALCVEIEFELPDWA